MASITTIQSTDFISDSRQVINDNFTAINNELATLGTGNVTKVGTPVNNQVGVWTGDGTLEGDAALTFDTTTDVLSSGGLLLSGLTASEIVGTDGSKNLVSLAVATYPSLTELSYVKGVTSAIQTQISAKAPSTSPTFATSITGSYLTASEILITDGSKNIVSAPVATYPSLTELSYVKGVTSAIQTQLNAKAATLSGTQNEIAYFNTTSTIASLAVATYPSLTELSYVKGVTSALQTQLGTKASTALSDLASVAINTTLVSDTDNTDALGTAAIGWSDLWLGNGAVITFSSAPSTADVTLTHSSNLLTLAGGDLALGANNLTMTGSLAATGARVTKGWFTDVESTNMPTVGGTAILTSLTAPQFTTIELGAASDTTISRVSAGVIAVEGVNVLTTTAIDDTAYGAGWNGDTTHAPTKNAVYDKIEALGGGGTWAQISVQTLGSNANTIDFSSIAAGYNMFRITGYLKITGAGSVHINFNSDTGNNYYYGIGMLNSGTFTADGSYGPLGYINCGGVSTSYLCPVEFLIQNDAAGNQKLVRATMGADFDDIRWIAGRWTDTSAEISAISFSLDANQFATGSKLILEGTTA